MVRRSIRNLKAAIEIASVGNDQQSVQDSRAELRTWEDQEDEFRYLSEVILSKQSNLRMTSSDIRLCVAIVDTELKAGEITPKRHGDNRTERPAPTPPTAVECKTVPVAETVPFSESVVDTPTTPDVLSIDEFLSSEESG